MIYVGFPLCKLDRKLSSIKLIQIKVFVELLYLSIFCLIIYIIFKTNSDNNFSNYILLFYGIYRSKPLIDLFNLFFIFLNIGHASIDLKPSALGPHSSLP